MFSMGATSTRSALIIENTKPDGSKETLIYDLHALSMSIEMNAFEGSRVHFDGHLSEGRLFTQNASPFDMNPQKELEASALALASNEEDAVIVEEES